jgi:hypothetical protein
LLPLLDFEWVKCIFRLLYFAVAPVELWTAPLCAVHKSTG